MKRFNDLTEQELLSLTDEQEQTYIELECAYNGVDIQMEIPVAPEGFYLQAELTGYEVGDFIFSTVEDAQAVVDFINKFPRRKSEPINYNWQYKTFIESDEDASYKTVSGYKVDSYNAAQAKIKDYQVKKDQYDIQIKEYREWETKVSEIREEISSKIEFLKEKEYKIKTYKAKYQKYLSLADGNAEVAKKFFNDAIIIDPEIQERVWGND